MFGFLTRFCANGAPVLGEMHIPERLGHGQKDSSGPKDLVAKAFAR